MDAPIPAATRLPERVVIINDASTARGGATGLALLSARLLRARGIAVTYVAGDAGDNPELAEPGIEVVAAGGARLLSQGALKSATRGIWNRSARALLARVVARDTPGTVYHLHGWAQILSPAVFTALAPVAGRVVTHAHDRFLACPNGIYHDFPADTPCTRRPMSRACLAAHCDKHSYQRKLWRVARQAVLHRAFPPRATHWGPIALIHPAMAPLMEEVGYPAARLITLRNPATPYRDSRIRAEENRGLAYVGRVEPEKNVEALAAAAREARMPLTVIGEGSQRAALAAAYPEVSFAGWQDRDGIARLVAGARAVVMPGRAPEPFGLVAAEASLSGLPVVISGSALLAQEIVAGGLGLSVDMHDPGALARALTRIGTMADATVKIISERGHARAAPLAQSPEGWANALVELYAGLI